jgi:NitT/TauT family transport system substrate-binding protein
LKNQGEFMSSYRIKSDGQYFTVFLALLFMAQFCAAALAQSKKEEITIGYASPSGVFAPLFVAQDLGLFKKYGLGVKELILLRGTGPAAAQMLVAGTAPIAALGGALVEAAMRGGGLAYIAATSNHLIFSLYSRPDITRPEELKGKTVGVDAKGGSIELATIVALKQFGLTLGKDVNAVYLGGPVPQLGALEKGYR